MVTVSAGTRDDAFHVATSGTNWPVKIASNVDNHEMRPSPARSVARSAAVDLILAETLI